LPVTVTPLTGIFTATGEEVSVLQALLGLHVQLEMAYDVLGFPVTVTTVLNGSVPPVQGTDEPPTAQVTAPFAPAFAEKGYEIGVKSAVIATPPAGIVTATGEEVSVLQALLGLHVQPENT
jgi:hypothetical protein